MEEEARQQLQCHCITSSQPSLEILRQLHELSASIFTPYFPATAHEHPSFDFSEWQRRLQLPNAVIFYATSSTSDRPLGFFNAMPLTQPEIGYELLHIWLVAVDPCSRGIGIFPLLMENVKKHARRCGYGQLTVCTRPKTFEKMYRILHESGWEEVAWRDKGEERLIQVLMKMSI